MRTELEQKLVDIILSDKYADTKVDQIKRTLLSEGWTAPFSTYTGGGYTSITTKNKSVYILNGVDELIQVDLTKNSKSIGKANGVES